MGMGIGTNLIRFAADESREKALEMAQGLRSSLESLAEVGSTDERAHAVALLESINRAIRDIQKGTFVHLARVFERY